MSGEDRQAQALHYEIMGIALAVRGHAGEGWLYARLDTALRELDWPGLEQAKRAFDMLPENMRNDILDDRTPEDIAGTAIRRYERYLRAMLLHRGEQSA